MYGRDGIWLDLSLVGVMEGNFSFCMGVIDGMFIDVDLPLVCGMKRGT